MTQWATEVASGTTCVRRLRLRLRPGGIDPQTAHQRIEAALNASRFGQAGLPESAILCIRTFRDPLPGTLRLQGRERGANAAWPGAAAAAFERLLRAALRPAVEPVSAASEVVLFLSPAELLVSLARDWRAGETASRWWWRTLFPRADARSALLGAWRDRVEYAPSALQQLAAREEAGPFIQALGPTVARDLFAALAEKFGLVGLLPLMKVNQPLVFDGAEAAALTASDLCAETAPGPASPATHPPWRAWITEREEDGLVGDSLLLLVTGLLLHRAPVAVRASVFPPRARAWLRFRRADLNTGQEPPPSANGSAAGGGPEPAPAPLFKAARARMERGPVQDPGLAAAPPRQGHPSANPMPDSDHAAAQLAYAAPTPGQASPPASLRGSYATAPADAMRLVQTALVEPALAVPQPPPGLGPTGSTEAPASMNLPVPAPPPPRPQPAVRRTPIAEAPAGVTDIAPDGLVKTQSGGVFYLINLGLFLELYGDFTSPLKPGLALPIWDFVALVGRHLVGERLEADPVWGLLARLSGRDGETEPGEGFLAPHDWPLPEDWKEFLAALPIEVPTDSGASGVSSSILPGEPPTGPQAGPTGPLTDWLEWLMPYLRWRLDRALGCDDADTAGRVLCEQPATVRVTEARLDVTFSLERLPIEVRLAGLDRDPGWVPSAGRFIAFHYD